MLKLSILITIVGISIINAIPVQRKSPASYGFAHREASELNDMIRKNRRHLLSQSDIHLSKDYAKVYFTIN